jgi:hypothetical protein
MTITEQEEILVPSASKRLSSIDQPRLYPLCLALVLGRGSKRGQLDDFTLNDNTVIEFGHDEILCSHYYKCQDSAISISSASSNHYRSVYAMEISIITNPCQH